MVDEARVVALLRHLRRDVATLRDLGAHRDAMDDVRLGAMKYAFVTAIEGCARVAQHIGASEGWRPPANNADALVVLGEQGVLGTDLASRLARAVGFRNILVHQYRDVDDEQVLANLEYLGDLDDFVSGISDWLRGPP